MAGDWIKVRDNLHEDPAVGRIATALGLDIYGVIGRLIRIWTWADQQVEDGNADVTHLYLDQLVNTPGMADAMVLARWLEVPESGRIHFPKYDRHMSKSAKKRALTKTRVQLHRSNAPVTNKKRKSVTREEKSSSYKHLPVTNSTATAQPPRNPTEGTPRSTPPLASTTTTTTPLGSFPAGGVEAFAQAHGVKVRKRPTPASFEDPQP